MKKLLMILAVSIGLGLTPALAIDNLNKSLTDENGGTAPDIQAPDKDGACSFNGADGKPVQVRCLRLRDAIFHALVFDFRDETGITGEERYKRGVLARRIHDAAGDSLPLVADEVAKIRLVTGKLYSPWYVTQIYDLVDPPK